MIYLTTTEAAQLPVFAKANERAPEAFITAWHEHLVLSAQAGDISDTTANTYRAGMRKFIAWMLESGTRIEGARTFASFKAAMLKDAKPASVNVWLSGVRAFYSWAVEAGCMNNNPARDVKGAKRKGANKTHKRDRLTDAEAARLLALPLPARERALIALKLYTGIRDTEAHRADLADLRTRDGFKVLMIQGKGHSDADDFVKINARCDDTLAAWLAERGNEPGPLFTSASDRNQGGRLSLSAIRTIVMAAYWQAGITEPTKTSHSTRHTAITKAALAAGVPAAQRMARHVDAKTTAIYLHEAARLENAAEDLIEY